MVRPFMVSLCPRWIAFARPWTGHSDKETNNRQRWLRLCREISGRLSGIHTSGLTSLEWLVRDARPHAFRDMPFSGYLSRQKK